MMRTAATAFVLIGCFTAFGCAGEKQQPQPATPQSAQQQGEAPTGCPMHISGTQVHVEESPEGVAIVYVAEDANHIGDLRKEVERIVAMHSRMQPSAQSMTTQPTTGAAEPHPHGHPGADAPPAGATAGARGAHPDMPHLMMSAKMHFDAAEGGAKLVLVPAERGQLDKLRQLVSQHVEAMQTGKACPMHGAPRPH